MLGFVWQGLCNLTKREKQKERKKEKNKDMETVQMARKRKTQGE